MGPDFIKIIFFNFSGYITDEGLIFGTNVGTYGTLVRYEKLSLGGKGSEVMGFRCDFQYTLSLWDGNFFNFSGYITDEGLIFGTNVGTYGTLVRYEKLSLGGKGSEVMGFRCDFQYLGLHYR